MTTGVIVTSSETGAIRAATALVRYESTATLSSLIGHREVKRTFSARERRLCGSRSTLDSWAGKFAAKLAATTALGLREADADLSDIEIVHRPWRPCRDATRCRMGHPPEVRLSSVLQARYGRDAGIDLSISHDGGYALASALRETS